MGHFFIFERSRRVLRFNPGNRYIVEQNFQKLCHGTKPPDANGDKFVEARRLIIHEKGKADRKAATQNHGPHCSDCRALRLLQSVETSESLHRQPGYRKDRGRATCRLFLTFDQ